MSSLNFEQKQAVEFSDVGPLLVLAGAGTGKTTVLTKRIEYLLTHLKHSPNRILAITFTNKAGNEIRKRLSTMGYFLPWVGTFHSICLKILRHEIYLLDREDDFKVIDPDDAIILIKEVMDNLGIDKKEVKPKQVLQMIDKFKTYNVVKGYDEDKMISFFEKNFYFYREWKMYKNNILKIWMKYEEKLRENNYLDFNDLLNYTNLIFKENETVLEYWREYFTYILIDEFQDTNDIQYELLMLLKNNDKNLFAVGDGDQTIYSFRGANPNIINNFINLISKERVIVLKTNYRSTQSILNISNQLITNNKNRFEKQLFAHNNIGEKPQLFSANNDTDEVSWVCKKIQELISKQVPKKEITILFRSNYLTRMFEHELILNSINYKVYGGLKFYQRAEIKDLIAYLTLVNNPDDEVSLTRVLNVPNRKIGATTQKIIRTYAFEENLSFYDALCNYQNLELTSIAKKGIENFLKLIEELRGLSNKPIHTILEEIISRTEYEKYYEKNDPERKDIIKENIQELQKAILLYENETSEPTLSEYLQNVSLIMEHEKNDDTVDAINLMTIHNSKGLEFDYVFLVCLNEGIFPTNSAIMENEIEEERRVAYVALTRARKGLFLSYSNGIDFIDKSHKQPSRFVYELGEKNVNKILKVSKPILKQELNWFDSQAPKVKLENYINQNVKITDFKIGDIIIHQNFGEGIIIGIEDEEKLKINFKNGNQKTILFNHSKIIRKIVDNE